MHNDNFSTLYLQSEPGRPTPSLSELLQQECAEDKSGILCPDSRGMRLGKYPDQRENEQDLAILFLDIRNFTGLLQNGSERENVESVKKILDFFSRIISSFGGRIVDRAGDSIYAVYGMDTTVALAANHALDSTKMLFEALNYINSGFAISKFGFPLQIGIGMHAGRVFVEYGRSPEMPLSVMGLTVNIAARLQEQTKYSGNDLILSHELYTMLTEANKATINRQTRYLTLQGIQSPQTIWLAGKPYPAHITSPDVDIEYLLAVAG